MLFKHFFGDAGLVPFFIMPPSRAKEPYGMSTERRKVCQFFCNGRDAVCSFAYYHLADYAGDGIAQFSSRHSGDNVFGASSAVCRNTTSVVDRLKRNLASDLF
jgi:hypothetical protein